MKQCLKFQLIKKERSASKSEIAIFRVSATLSNVLQEVLQVAAGSLMTMRFFVIQKSGSPLCVVMRQLVTFK